MLKRRVTPLWDGPEVERLRRVRRSIERRYKTPEALFDAIAAMDREHFEKLGSNREKKSSAKRSPRVRRA